MLAAFTARCEPARRAPMRALAEVKLAGTRGADRQVAQAFARMDRCIVDRAAIPPVVDRAAVIERMLRRWTVPTPDEAHRVTYLVDGADPAWPSWPPG